MGARKKMVTLNGLCPNCQHENSFSIRTYGEQIAELEQDNQDGFHNGTIKDFETENSDSPCRESLETRIDCEKCGEDYSIEESLNWDELKARLHL